MHLKKVLLELPSTCSAMGNEPAYEDPYNPYGSIPMQDTEMYRLDNDEFGLDEGADAFLGDFDPEISYDPGDIVMYEGMTYIALEGVPAGALIGNSNMWKELKEEVLYGDNFTIKDYYDPMKVDDDDHAHEEDHDEHGEEDDHDDHAHEEVTTIMPTKKIMTTMLTKANQWRWFYTI